MSTSVGVVHATENNGDPTQQIEVSFCEVLKMSLKTRERSFLPEGRLEYTWKSLLPGYSNEPRSKQRPDVQGRTWRWLQASMKSMYIAWERRNCCLIFKYSHYRCTKAILTAMNSSNESNLQFITGKSLKISEGGTRRLSCGRKHVSVITVKPIDVQQVLNHSLN